MLYIQKYSGLAYVPVYNDKYRDVDFFYPPRMRARETFLRKRRSLRLRSTTSVKKMTK